MVEWDTLAPGGVANYTCDPGFILVGDRTRICGSDGTWSGMAPTCERKFSTNITSFVNFILLEIHVDLHIIHVNILTL